MPVKGFAGALTIALALVLGSSGPRALSFAGAAGTLSYHALQALYKQCHGAA